MHRTKLSSLLAAVFFVGCGMPVMAANPLSLETRTAPSGEKYLFVLLNGASVNFTVEKPKRENPEILVAIPAGFVTADEKPIGVLVFNGEVHNRVNPKLGGALEILGGKFKLIDTNNGAGFTPQYLDKIARKGGCLFQQFTIVKDRNAQVFKDKGKYLRRAIGHLSSGAPILVESKSWITLQKFASDMVALGVQDLLYTDMGPWKESWIRDPDSGALLDIGNEKAKPIKQLNWLTVTEPPTNSHTETAGASGKN